MASILLKYFPELWLFLSNHLDFESQNKHFYLFIKMT
jgi:hypothetical protein